VYPVFPPGATEAASALRFAHRYVPATSLGGDFCDIMPLSDTQCGVLMCDVMGHGVRAGLLTALIRGIVREISAGAARPGHVLGEINRALTPILGQLGQPLFATVFFGVVDTAAATLTMGNAGHPPPLVRRHAGGAVEPLRLADPEPAAGLVEGFAYSERVFGFGPGDLLLAYTDGSFEAEDGEGVQFGEERVRAFVAEAGPRPIGQLIDGLLEEVRRFAGRREFEDDVCILAVQRSLP
jgi:sigma-B regulation protein RsbU (phosphoserine phosphatase)